MSLKRLLSLIVGSIFVLAAGVAHAQTPPPPPPAIGAPISRGQAN